jgi:hypothetical protein
MATVPQLQILMPNSLRGYQITTCTIFQISEKLVNWPFHPYFENVDTYSDGLLTFKVWRGRHERGLNSWPSDHETGTLALSHCDPKIVGITKTDRRMLLLLVEKITPYLISMSARHFWFQPPYLKTRIWICKDYGVRRRTAGFEHQRSCHPFEAKQIGKQVTTSD